MTSSFIYKIQWTLALFIGVAYTVPQQSFAYSKRSYCTKTELKMKNCALQLGSRKFHFRPEKVLLHNGVNRGLLKQKYIGETIEWEKAWVQKISGVLFVQMLIWSEPKTEAEVQKLHWLVVRTRGSKPDWAIDRVVQKRSKKPNSEAKKKTHLYEKRDKFSIGPKDNKWMWFQGRLSGPLP